MNQTILNLEEEVIKIVHTSLNIPTLIAQYLFTGLFILITGLILLNSGYKKFWLIWIIGMILSGGLLLFFIYCPFTVLEIFAKIKGFF